MVSLFLQVIELYLQLIRVIGARLRRTDTRREGYSGGFDLVACRSSDTKVKQAERE